MARSGNASAGLLTGKSPFGQSLSMRRKIRKTAKLCAATAHRINYLRIDQGIKLPPVAIARHRPGKSVTDCRMQVDLVQPIRQVRREAPQPVGRHSAAPCESEYAVRHYKSRRS